MTLIEKIPGLNDDELGNLLANARRLNIVGNPRQQTAAAEVLPALELEASTRRATKLELAIKARKPSARKTKASVAAAAAAAVLEADEAEEAAEMAADDVEELHAEAAA